MLVSVEPATASTLRVPSPARSASGVPASDARKRPSFSTARTWSRVSRLERISIPATRRSASQTTSTSVGPEKPTAASPAGLVRRIVPTRSPLAPITSRPPATAGDSPPIAAASGRCFRTTSSGTAARSTAASRVICRACATCTHQATAAHAASRKTCPAAVRTRVEEAEPMIVGFYRAARRANPGARPVMHRPEKPPARAGGL